MSKKLRILLVRHGQSEGNVDEAAYDRLGDVNVPLTEKGWQQAIRLGEKFLGPYYKRTNTDQWPLIYASGYKRPLETLSGALHGMGAGVFDGAPQIYEDVRLIEQSFGSLNHLEHAEHSDDHSRKTASALLGFSKAMEKKDPMTARPLHGESYIDTMVRTKNFIDGTLWRDIKEDHEDIIIFAHGRTITAFIANWFHVPLNQIKGLEGRLKTPGNCDVIAIEGDPKSWTVKKIYDGQSGEECDIDYLENVRWPTLSNLPEVPKDFKIR